MIYQFITLTHTDACGAPYTIGHAITWEPRRVRMELIASRDALARDTATSAGAPYYVKIGLADRVTPYPAWSVRTAIQKCPGGIAYFSAGESGMQVNPLIENGKLLTKPQGARAAHQKDWTPLNDTFTFFLQHADARAEIRDLRIAQNRIHADDRKHISDGTNGFAVPRILKNGARVPLKNPPPGKTARGGETLYELGAPAALSAIGLTAAGRAVWIGLIGDTENPTDWDRVGTEEDLAHYLLDLGVTDAVFAGVSGDVQYYDARTQTLCVAAERPKPEDMRWVLMPGQTERGLACIVELVE